MDSKEKSHTPSTKNEQPEKVVSKLLPVKPEKATEEKLKQGLG